MIGTPIAGWPHGGCSLRLAQRLAVGYAHVFGEVLGSIVVPLFASEAVLLITRHPGQSPSGEMDAHEVVRLAPTDQPRQSY
jgi:hypothetical protein